MNKNKKIDYSRGFLCKIVNKIKKVDEKRSNSLLVSFSKSLSLYFDLKKGVETLLNSPCYLRAWEKGEK